MLYLHHLGFGSAAIVRGDDPGRAAVVELTQGYKLTRYPAKANIVDPLLKRSSFALCGPTLTQEEELGCLLVLNHRRYLHSCQEVVVFT